MFASNWLPEIGAKHRRRNVFAVNSVGESIEMGFGGVDQIPVAGRSSPSMVNETKGARGTCASIQPTANVWLAPFESPFVFIFVSRSVFVRYDRRVDSDLKSETFRGQRRVWLSIHARIASARRDNRVRLNGRGLDRTSP